MMQSLKKLSFFLVAVSLAMPFQAFAQESGGGQTKLLMSKSISDAYEKSTEESLAQEELRAQDTVDSFKGFVDKTGSVMFAILKNKEMANLEMPPFYYQMSEIISERVISRFGTTNVRKMLDEMMREGASGHAEVESSGSTGAQNPFAMPALAADTYLYDMLSTEFCNPASANASPECKEQKGVDDQYSNQNFIDFFISDRTWTNSKILDVMLLARRFFGILGDRPSLGYGILDIGNFVSSQESLTKANLRMAVLNNLASRRAPTSTSGKAVLSFSLEILNNTGQLASVDPTILCNSKDNETYNSMSAIGKYLTSYVCSFTSIPEDGGQPIISQAAIDRILQHDFYFSPQFYGSLNSTAYSEIAIKRLQVFMKAQQVSQDYDSLLLQQQQTALKAMHMMNTKP